MIKFKKRLIAGLSGLGAMFSLMYFCIKLGLSQTSSYFLMGAIFIFTVISVDEFLNKLKW